MNLDLDSNAISDISALVDNSGIDVGDDVSLVSNPLSQAALDDIAALQARGAAVYF